MKQRFACLAVAVAGWMFACPAVAPAGISGPPQSYATPTRDGKHLLVMLSSVPLRDDRGNVCKLPNGQTVNLRELFASSGLYEIGPPPIPVWTVDWYEEVGLVRLSPDGRYVVRVNRFGGGRYGQPVTSHWCLRFYDRGVQTKIYHTNELVDYPSLMEFTPSDWHYLWIDDSVYRAEIDDGFIVLNTTTHESYRFDVSTGEIVAQFRLWRWVARGTALLAAAGLIAGCWFCYRRAIRKTDRAAAASPPLPARPQFGIRSLFALIAGLLGTYLVAAHVAVFLTSATIAISLSFPAIWGRRHASSSSSGFFARCRQAMLWLMVLTSWLIVYALSSAPALALAMYLRVPHDVRMILAQVVYAPIWWLFTNTRIHDWQPVELYYRAWG